MLKVLILQCLTPVSYWVLTYYFVFLQLEYFPPIICGSVVCLLLSWTMPTLPAAFHDLRSELCHLFSVWTLSQAKHTEVPKASLHLLECTDKVSSVLSYLRKETVSFKLCQIVPWRDWGRTSKNTAESPMTLRVASLF